MDTRCYHNPHPEAMETKVKYINATTLPDTINFGTWKQLNRTPLEPFIAGYINAKDANGTMHR